MGKDFSDFAAFLQSEGSRVRWEQMAERFAERHPGAIFEDELMLQWIDADIMFHLAEYHDWVNG